jgi:uncharacterized Fe-S cluster-containing radical SAM superfamily protein
MLKNLAKELVRRWTRQSLEVDNFADSPYYDQNDLERWATDKARYLRTHYLEYPALVHMETVAVCNAACTFCPYTELDRKGTRMSDALIEKIIDDLTDIPRDLKFHLSPYKVSDPFLESRLFDILARVNEKLPNAGISLITNGSALTERNIDQLTRVRNITYLSVSLNFCDPVEYEEVMKLPLERTLARLEILNRKHAEGKIDFPLRITRVSVSSEADRLFLQWCKERYPAFRISILPRNDWIGVIDVGNFASQVPDVPCHRWFDLSITATGVVAMCCMDSKAEYPKGDVNRQHVLEIYNQPWLRNLREQLMSRRAAGGPCERCTYLSY